MQWPPVYAESLPYRDLEGCLMPPPLMRAEHMRDAGEGVTRYTRGRLQQQKGFS